MILYDYIVFTQIVIEMADMSQLVAPPLATWSMCSQARFPPSSPHTWRWISGSNWQHFMGCQWGYKRIMIGCSGVYVYIHDRMI